MSNTIRGIIPSLVTPWSPDGTLDESALRTEIQFVLRHGVHAILVCGSTGEGHTLSIDESVRMTRIALRETDGLVPVYAGVIQPSTADAVEYAKALEDAGAYALQITPLHYFAAPSLSAVEAFYVAIGSAVNIPLIVFNLASRGAITTTALERWSQIPNVVAIKQSGGDFHKLADLVLANASLPAKRQLQIVTALDELLYPSFVLGAGAAITTALVTVPDLTMALWDACHRNDYAESLRLNHRILTVTRTLMLASDRYPRIRAALELRGIPVGPPRPPSEPASEQAVSDIGAALLKAGLISGLVADV